MSYDVLTSLTGQHRWHYAQLGLIGLMCNGHDANKICDLRTGQAKDLGMAAPGAAPTGVDAGGVLTGTYRWRVRWKDSSTGAISLPSAELTDTLAAETKTITKPGSAPARADFWILERTLDEGTVFYPVNVDSSNPHGTLIGTPSYADTVQDSTLRNRSAQGLTTRQGQPRRYRFCWVNGNHLFMGGGRVHQPNCSLTNGLQALTSGDGDFNASMIGEFVTFDEDTDGKSYQLSGFTDANSMTIAEVYAGTTKASRPCKIAGVRDSIAWCELFEPEHWGAELPGRLQNTVRIGSDGEPVVAGIGLGQSGSLICKERSMYYLNYRVVPNGPPNGDGQLVQIRTDRGASGPRAVCAVNDVIYGCDVKGVWRLRPGGMPEEIGQALANDWKTLNFSMQDNFIVDYDSYAMLVYVFVCGPGESYPKRAYLWDLEGERWVGTKTWPYGITGTYRLPDANGAERLGIYNEAVGSVYSYAWFEGIGTSLGGTSTTPNLTGNVTGGSSTTLQNSGAAWPTSGDKLKGLPVTLIRAADASEETQLITDNTGTQLTTNAFSGTAPASGDTYRIGALEASWKTGRLDCGEAERKKKFVGVWLRLKYASGVVPLKVRAYFDGSATAQAWPTAKNEDGVAITAGARFVTVTPQTGILRYFVPLDGQWHNDVQLEFFSSDPGAAWEMFDAVLVYELDEKPQPGKDKTYAA